MYSLDPIYINTWIAIIFELGMFQWLVNNVHYRGIIVSPPIYLFWSKLSDWITILDLTGDNGSALGCLATPDPYCWLSFFRLALSAALAALYSWGETKWSVFSAWIVLGPVALRYSLLGDGGKRGNFSLSFTTAAFDNNNKQTNKQTNNHLACNF